MDELRAELRDRDAALRLGATQLKEVRAAMDKLQRAASGTIEGLQKQLAGVGSASTQEALHLMSELEMLQQQYAELSEEKATLEERLHALIATIEAAGGDAGAVRLQVEQSAQAVPAGRAFNEGGDGIPAPPAGRVSPDPMQRGSGGGGGGGEGGGFVNLKAEEDEDDPFSEAAIAREREKNAGDSINSVDAYLTKRKMKEAKKLAEKERILSEKVGAAPPSSPAWAGGDVVVGREHARSSRRGR
jgi:hypothetical protein|tara:strand:- start:1071 stop:1805 length:735 start_codon:yes stop_codon:yes gene_type:complete